MPHIRNLLIHLNMENIIVLSGEQLEDVIYKTVSRCLEEKHIGNYVEKPEEDGFYSRDEICSLLHIAYPTLWRIEKSGLLKSQKVGRKNLYSKAEVTRAHRVRQHCFIICFSRQNVSSGLCRSNYPLRW